MTIKKAVKYQMSEMKKSVIAYYGVLYAIYILLTIFIGVYVSAENNEVFFGSIGGLEIPTTFFIFVMSLTSFKDTFKMFLQNGLSRGTLFKSFILSIIPLSVFMSLMDGVNMAIIKIISNYGPMYLQIYGRNYAEGISEIVEFLSVFLLNIFTYLMVAMIGYFFAVLYYRMNKIVFVGVPVFLFFLLPIIEVNFTNGAIMQVIERYIDYTFGFENGYTLYNYIIISLLVFVIFGGLSYGLMKKVVVKSMHLSDLPRLH